MDPPHVVVDLPPPPRLGEERVNIKHKLHATAGSSENLEVDMEVEIDNENSIGKQQAQRQAWVGDTLAKIAIKPTIQRQYYTGEGEEDDLVVEESLEDTTDPNSTCPKYRQRINSAWHLKEDVSLVYVGNGFYIVRFWHKSDYYKVLGGGPWTVLVHYLIVHRWRAGFKAAEEKVSKTRVWVRFPGISVEMFNRECIEDFAQGVGKDPQIDIFTTASTKGEFARVSLEVDLSKPLLGHIWLENKKREVKYEGLDLICFNCGVVGHLSEVCSGERVDGIGEDISLVNSGKKETLASSTGDPPKKEVKYGQWMHVPRRNTKKIFPTMKRPAREGQATAKRAEEPRGGRRRLVVGRGKEYGFLMREEETKG